MMQRNDNGATPPEPKADKASAAPRRRRNSTARALAQQDALGHDGWQQVKKRDSQTPPSEL